MQKTTVLYQPVDEDQLFYIFIYVHSSRCLKRPKMEKDIEEPMSSPMHDNVPMTKAFLTLLPCIHASALSYEG